MMIDMKFDRLYLEITNTCNLTCPFCPPHQRTNHFMTLETFQHILDEVSPFGDHLYFHLKGEPTLHPKLESFLDLAHHHNKRVHLVTNGTLLGRLSFDLGAHPALASMVISLHSLHYLTQSAQNAILSDLTHFLDHNRQRPLTIYLRLWNENNGKLLQWLSTYVGFQVTYSPAKQRRKLIDNLVLDTDQEFEWPSLDHPHVSDHGTCYGGLKMMAVMSDGQVTPCCLDHNAKINLGNVLITPLSTILKSERYQTFRDGLEHGQLREDLCQRCTYHLKHKKRISR